MKKTLISFLSILLLATGGAYAARCDFDKLEEGENLFINPNYVLCSVHAYNIGQTTNPTSSDQRGYMDEVVRLKTTIIAQQMKRQYDFLEMTIRRLETQLQKAMLTAKLEAAGVPTSNQANNNSSSNKLAGIQDCNALSQTSAMIDCLANNVLRMRENATARKDMSQVRKQLNTDINQLKTIATADSRNELNIKCSEQEIGKGWEQMLTCLNIMNAAIATKRDELARGNQNAMRQAQGYPGGS